MPAYYLSILKRIIIDLKSYRINWNFSCRPELDKNYDEYGAPPLPQSGKIIEAN
jgi:hypothetical protein